MGQSKRSSLEAEHDEVKASILIKHIHCPLLGLFNYWKTSRLSVETTENFVIISINRDHFKFLLLDEHFYIYFL